MGDFISELKKRRVLPAIGVYVASCWVVIEILDRLAERYLWSPYITDAAFWGLYSLIPAVVLVAWSHGKPGKDRATTAEKVGIPINLIATIGLLVTAFGGKDLGAAADLITVANEDGVQETHYVPSESFRRRMAVFFFENTSGDPELDWLQYGVTELLVQDLQQNPFILATSPWSNFGNGFYARMRRSGFEDGLGVPRSLMRAIAEDANRQHFIEGQVDREGGAFRITARIWDTASLQQAAEINKSGFDLYGVVDAVSREVREALAVPKASGRMAQDLPLGETYGESEEAFRLYIDGLNERLFNNDFEASNALLDQALEADPSFVRAWFVKVINGLDAGEIGDARKSIAEAQKLGYRLPTSDRNNLKWMGYRLAGDNDKAIAFLRLQAQLHNDAATNIQLARLLMITGAMDEAKIQYHRAREKDPVNVESYQQLAALERATGDLEKAISFAKHYQQERPEDYQSSLLVGDLLRDSGDLDGADENYLQASLVSDQTVLPLLRLSDIAARKGDANAARRLLEQAEAIAGDANQAGIVRQYASQLEYRLGMVRNAIAQLASQAELWSQSQAVFTVAIATDAPMSSMYVDLGQLGQAETVLRRAQEAVPPPLNRFLAFFEVNLHLARHDTQAAREALGRAVSVLEQFQMEPLRFHVALTEGMILAEEQNPAAQAAKLKEALVLLERAVIAIDVGNLPSILLASLTESLVLTGDMEGAEQALERGFGLDPAEPTLWVAKARYQRAAGLPQLAQASVNYALAIWKDADPDYRAYAEALELQAEISRSL